MSRYSYSTLKSFKKDYLIEIIRSLENNNEALEERVNNQYRLLLEKDKYRWHDLRKNPNDLPPDFHTVEICIKGFEGYVAGISLAMHNTKSKIWGSCSWQYKDYKVIAWKYIEPFEVKR